MDTTPLISGSAPLPNEFTAHVYGMSGINTLLVYVGGTTNPQRREKEQFSALEQERHFNNNLQQLYYCLGREQLVFKPLESAHSREDLAAKEQKWITELSKTHETLNIRLAVPKSHSCGYKLTDETRQRQSSAKKGANHPSFGKSIPIEKTRAQIYYFRSPSGEILRTHGLRDFAARHGLNVSILSKLNRGIVKTHRGYTRVEGYCGATGQSV